MQAVRRRCGSEKIRVGTLSRDFGQVCWQTTGCPADGLLSTPHIDVLVYDRRVTHVSAPSTRNQR